MQSSEVQYLAIGVAQGQMRGSEQRCMYGACMAHVPLQCKVQVQGTCILLAYCADRKDKKTALLPVGCAL